MFLLVLGIVIEAAVWCFAALLDKGFKLETASRVAMVFSIGFATLVVLANFPFNEPLDMGSALTVAAAALNGLFWITSGQVLYNRRSRELHRATRR
jgi:hypothetical protein